MSESQLVELNTRIAELQKRLLVAEVPVNQMRLELKDMLDARATMQTPFAVGDRVEMYTKPYQITAIKSAGSGSRTVISGRLIKKNGMPGSVVRELYGKLTRI